jgi:hypothetical protein
MEAGHYLLIETILVIAFTLNGAVCQDSSTNLPESYHERIQGKTCYQHGVGLEDFGYCRSGLAVLARWSILAPTIAPITGHWKTIIY